MKLSTLVKKKSTEPKLARCRICGRLPEVMKLSGYTRVHCGDYTGDPMHRLVVDSKVPAKAHEQWNALMSDAPPE